MAAKHENVRELAKKAKGSLPCHGVAHQRAAAVRMELVQVIEGLERAPDHLVGKEMRWLHPNDASMKLLPNAQMAGFENDEVSEVQGSRDDSGRVRPFLGKCRGREMDRNVSGQVETALPGRADAGFEDECRQCLGSRQCWAGRRPFSSMLTCEKTEDLKMPEAIENGGRSATWLAGTYWYCAAETVPALRTQSRDSLQAVMDQTVWFVSGARQGYFWGVGSGLITALGETPDLAGKSDFTFYGSLTPDGRVHITFFVTGGSTIGTGILVGHQGRIAFEMQMSSGPTSCMVVHWAYMLQVQPGDPAWDRLPGTNGASVEDMVGGLTPPQVLEPAAGNA